MILHLQPIDENIYTSEITDFIDSFKLFDVVLNTYIITVDEYPDLLFVNIGNQISVAIIEYSNNIVASIALTLDDDSVYDKSLTSHLLTKKFEGSYIELQPLQ